MFILNSRLTKFLSYYKPYTALFAADIACSMAVSAISLIIPLCVRRVTGDILKSGGKDVVNAVFTMALVMLGLVIVQTGCALFYDYMGHAMGARMERDMRNDLFSHYQSLPFSFFDREKTGTIISRISNDLLSIAELCHHGPEDIIVYLLTFVGALIILFTINGSLALAVCAFLPLMFIFSFFYSLKLKKVYTENRKQIAAVSARIEDSIAGIRVVKSFGNEALENGLFKKANEQFYRSRTGIYKCEAWYYTTIATFFTQLLIVAIVVYGGMKLSGTDLETADFISFLLYAGYLTAPLPQLARITAQYQEGWSGFKRFMEVMETPGEKYREKNTSVLSAVRGDVEFSRVNFRYSPESEYILKDISFKVRAGEYVALTGPSGIGKTTTLSLIPRFYEACSGTILIDGHDVRNVNLDSLREHIGIVQQDVYVFSGTIRDNIAYGKPGAGDAEIIAAAKKSNAHDFIMSLKNGYDTEIGQRGITLSGGQRQRLCIARVFLKDPAILIFDEATSALDYESERVIQEGLRSLSRSRTSFVIAHRLSTIRDADRVLLFDGQEIMEED